MTWAAATAPNDIGHYDSGEIRLLMKASETIYKGSLVAIDADGLAINTPSNGLLFAGVAVETVAAAASGDYYIRVATKGIWPFTLSSVAQTNVGDVAYMSLAADNQTLVLSDPGATIKVGKIAYIGTNLAWVMIDHYAFDTTCESS
jgi:hypothetical protein